MKYQYSDELKRVLEALRAVKKSYSYRNLADKALNPEHASTLRRAYLTAMRTDLLKLHGALDEWVTRGAKMEETE